jgi:hypothetical protein
MLIEVGFLVAFGALLDALLVRSVLVPALTLLIGRRIWWPSRPSRPAELPDGQQSLADDEEPALQRQARRHGRDPGRAQARPGSFMGPTAAAPWFCAVRPGQGSAHRGGVLPRR